MGRKWPPGEEMEAFVGIVNRIRSEKRGSRKKATWVTVLAELERYNRCVDHSETSLFKVRDKLKADYARIKQEMLRRDCARWSWTRPEEWYDADDLVDEIERCCCRNNSGVWEIDWPAARDKLHPHEPNIDVERLKARYEHAVQFCQSRFVTPGAEDARSNPWARVWLGDPETLTFLQETPLTFNSLPSAPRAKTPRAFHDGFNLT